MKWACSKLHYCFCLKILIVVTLVRRHIVRFVPRSITVMKLHYLIHRHIIINVHLPTVENCHLSCWPIHCIQGSGTIGKISVFWTHLLLRGRLYLFLRRNLIILQGGHTIYIFLRCKLIQIVHVLDHYLTERSYGCFFVK